jgi:CheY-like chemotaxis protein
MPLRVLVVEDEASLRSLLSDILAELGHEAVATPDGESALESLRADAQGFDAAIVDLVLPGMDGLETARALRALRPSLRLVISTGHDERTRAGAGALAEARREGFAVLGKPYRFEQLEGVLTPAGGA